MKVIVEMTDTFGGQANYAWFKRWVITCRDGATDRSIVRAAKKAAGISGVRCDTSNFGDSFEIRPRKSCVVVFAMLGGEDDET